MAVPLRVERLYLHSQLNMTGNYPMCVCPGVEIDVATNYLSALCTVPICV